MKKNNLQIITNSFRIVNIRHENKNFNVLIMGEKIKATKFQKTIFLSKRGFGDQLPTNEQYNDGKGEGEECIYLYTKTTC